jgi:hypothetical protein
MSSNEPVLTAFIKIRRTYFGIWMKSARESLIRLRYRAAASPLELTRRRDASKPRVAVIFALGGENHVGDHHGQHHGGDCGKAAWAAGLRGRDSQQGAIEQVAGDSGPESRLDLATVIARGEQADAVQNFAHSEGLQDAAMARRFIESHQLLQLAGR